MTDEESKPQAGTEQPAGQEPPAADGEDVATLPPWAQEMIKGLRKENAGHRRAKAEAERLAREAAEQAAKEQGRWQELAQAYEPKAKRAELLEAFIAEQVEESLKALPEPLRGLVPEFDDPLAKLRWLRKAERTGIFKAPAPPETDGRRQGSGQHMTNEDRLALAARLGIDPRYLPHD